MAGETTTDQNTTGETSTEGATTTTNTQNTSAADTTATSTSTNSKTASAEDADMISKLVNARVEEQLKDIKGKLDKAFSARDEALNKVAEFEKKERDRTLKQLEEDGKHKEAAEMRLAEKEAELAILRKQNMELSRDVSVRNAMSQYQFRNDKATEMAFREITNNLVQNEQGQWVHRSGISIKDYVDAFSRDDDQAFLFKAKSNSGGGTTNNASSTNDTSSGKPKSLFEMTQAEVLKLAAEGKIGQHQTF